ncbi:flagellar hook basal-body protein [Trichlorobacter sp.]|uniref:flagellar hook-basal body protein n=1 Tax=Trichlorobacter sp. TaxID=2911007 RepID=UPI002A366950|nr:flagellar hook basal-body protein [Trichlorobacter sp.]MDY0383162.1 flagellar hook basal-body protein [Trichlorobacter sp.]
MSITSAMFSGVSGLLANAEGINVIGNNLANVNTVGFKYNRMLFADMMYVDAGNGSQLGRGTQIQKIDTVMGQGAFESTEVVTDLAIQGEGFFALGMPNTTVASAEIPPNSAYYTRAGTFRIGPAEGTNLPLITPLGYKVLDENAKPIFIPATLGTGTFQKITSIENNGIISILYADPTGLPTTAYYAGPGVVNTDISAAKRVGYATVNNPPALSKEGGNLFKSTIASGTPSITKANGNNSKIFSNSLEQSNVDMAAQFVKMILTQRAYSANSKTITTADEMTQEVLNLKR